MRVTVKGQVTIPKDIRDKLGIEPGSEVEFVPDERGARLRVLKSDPTRHELEKQFEEWLDSVAGTVDLHGMTTDEYMEWIRGPREDLDPR
jgi:AbrB family looped-hinge helix DNA binding protein